MSEKKNFTISGKICVVTGGASGIGLSFVNRLLEHSAQEVYILDLNLETGVEAEQQLQKKYDISRVKFIKSNVTQPDSLKEIFAQIITQSKRIDLLMNNAGTDDPSLVISVNLMGVFNCLELAIKYMSKENGGPGGVIINTASNFGLIGCNSFPLYSASKHGVVGLTRSYGYECFYEKSGISVMAICPSPTQTPLLERALSKVVAFKGQYSDGISCALQQSPENVADCMLLALIEGCPGSIFVSERGENYEIVVPHYKELRKK